MYVFSFLKILVGNKSDVAETKRAIPYAVGKALADEYNIQFFETSAKENRNVEEASWFIPPYLANLCFWPSFPVAISLGILRNRAWCDLSAPGRAKPSGSWERGRILANEADI